MFLLMLCRKKNPEILNIVGHAFLANCAMEGVTSPVKGKSNSIKTFRNALGIDSFAGSSRNKTTAKPITQPTVKLVTVPTEKPTTKPIAPPITQPTTPPTVAPTAKSTTH